MVSKLCNSNTNSVDNGSIFRQAIHGADIISDKTYKDFEMLLDEGVNICMSNFDALGDE